MKFQKLARRIKVDSRLAGSPREPLINSPYRWDYSRYINLSTLLEFVNPSIKGKNACGGARCLRRRFPQHRSGIRIAARRLAWVVKRSRAVTCARRGERGVARPEGRGAGRQNADWQNIVKKRGIRGDKTAKLILN